MSIRKLLFVVGMAALLLVANAAAVLAQGNTFTITDPESDHIDCLTGEPAPFDRPSIDIGEVTFARNDNYLIIMVTTAGPIQAAEVLAAGIEIYVPPPVGNQPAPAGWFFDNVGNQSWNVSFNEVNLNTGLATVGQDGLWAPGSSIFKASRNGNTIIFEIPLFEIPPGALFVVTTTDFFVNSEPRCDEVGLTPDKYAGIVPPGQQAGTDIIFYNGNTPVDVPAPGLLANDAPGCTEYQVPSFSSNSGQMSLDQNGTFVYTPRPGFQGFDDFTYTVVCDGQSTTGRVSLQPADIIWYVDSNAPSGGSGDLQNPFSSLDDVANAIQGGTIQPNDVVFLQGGAYEGGVTRLRTSSLWAADLRRTWPIGVSR